MFDFWNDRLVKGSTGVCGSEVSLLRPPLDRFQPEPAAWRLICGLLGIFPLRRNQEEKQLR